MYKPVFRYAVSRWLLLFWDKIGVLDDKVNGNSFDNVFRWLDGEDVPMPVMWLRQLKCSLFDLIMRICPEFWQSTI